MSYRHSSFRKMSKVAKKAMELDSNEIADLPRNEVNRVLEWSLLDPLPKPEGWGKPKAKRAAGL